MLSRATEYVDVHLGDDLSELRLDQRIVTQMAAVDEDPNAVEFGVDALAILVITDIEQMYDIAHC